MNYYISDIHFGHENILRYCKRPFSSVEEMDETIISNWNKKVKNSDTVYILGDLMYKNVKSPSEYLSRLKGKKVLILGNHDETWFPKFEEKEKYFTSVASYCETRLNNHNVTLCHYPMIEWKDSRKAGSNKLGYLIYGHIHARKDEKYRYLFSIGNALNAGADINNFEPVTFSELLINNDKFKLSLMTDDAERAEYLCRRYHMNMCDKSGKAYCEHPIYVASQLEEKNEKIVALLHDTLEDTDISEDLISSLFGEEMLASVKCMTRRQDEDYFDYIKRVSQDPIARKVKIEDLKHNMDLSRLQAVTDRDIERAEKYKKALEMLN